MVAMPIEPMKGFSIGADPELFVLDETGKPVSAAGLIPGTKAVPHKVEGGAIQVDGMAAEFNIDPCTSFTEFNDRIKLVMKQLQGFLPTGYTLSAVPCIVFDEDVWDAAPEEAKELGCSPDFNAWTGTVNPPPNCPSNLRLRTASGHLHIGWTDDADMGDIQHILNCQDLVKQLDWYLGAWSLKMDPDPTRRLLYGKAGACRYKPYGVEYRVLSNFWLTTKERRLQVWNRLNQAIYDMQNMFMPDKAKNYNEFLVSSIGTSKRNRMLETQFRFPLTTIHSNYR